MTEQEKELINNLADMFAVFKKNANEIILDDVRLEGYLSALLDTRYETAQIIRSIFGNNAAIDFHERIVKH